MKKLFFDMNELMDIQRCCKCDKKVKGVYYVRFIKTKKIYFCEKCYEKEGFE